MPALIPDGIHAVTQTGIAPCLGRDDTPVLG